MKYSFFAAQSVVFALAVTLQTLVCKEHDASHAPFAFVSGLVVGFLPPLVAGFALVLAVITSFGISVGSAYFPVLAGAVCAVGFTFTGKKNVYALTAVAVAVGLPWLLTLLFPRHFVSSFRAKPKVNTPLPLR